MARMRCPFTLRYLRASGVVFSKYIPLMVRYRTMNGNTVLFLASASTPVVGQLLGNQRSLLRTMRVAMIVTMTMGMKLNRKFRAMFS